MSIARARDRKTVCPLCGKPSAERHKPFCGQGCRDRDLLNWLGDSYRVAGESVNPEALLDPEDGLDSGR